MTAVTLDNKVREERSVLNYIGTIPEQAVAPKGCGGVAARTPISWANIHLDDVSQSAKPLPGDRRPGGSSFRQRSKFFSGPVRTYVRDRRAEFRASTSVSTVIPGLTSEAIGAGSPNGSGSLHLSLAPPNRALFTTTPTLTGNPNIIPVDTKSVYALETANYQDYLIFTAGLRFDQTQYQRQQRSAFPRVSASSARGITISALVYKPMPDHQPIRRLWHGSEPVGSELDGTSANYGGLNPIVADQSDFQPESRARPRKSATSGNCSTAICW